ncbi:ATP-binding protein [Geobacter sp. OR-1]|uniref:ATP-binding protein n=1 Tax=Geobacter sp. OR-1 TaxID=1266765 RepID=UPI000A68ABBF|nr:ATP-binding protein [Geobacter sp. OR-1]
MTAVPVAIILYSAYTQHEQNIGKAKLLVERLADNVSDDQNILLSGTEQLLSTLSQLPAVKNHSAKAVNALLADLVKKTPQYSNLIIADRNGIQWAAAIPAKGPVSTADRRYFRNAIASGQFSSGEYAIGRILKKPVQHFAYPIKDSSGNVTDVAVVVFTLDNYITRYKLKNMPAGNMSLLFTDHKGTILFNVTAPETLGKQDRNDLFKRMTNGPDKGTFEAVSNIGIRRYFAYQKLRLGGEQAPYMYVRAGIPVETILGETRSKLMFNMAVMSSMLLLAVGFAVFISKKGVIDKVIALRDATQKVARGDLDVRISDYVSGGELGDLGRSFDEMTQALINDNEERTRHEKELSQYADIVARMQVGLYVYRLEDPNNDRSLRLLTVNPTSVNLLGLSEQQIVGRTIDEIFPALRQAGIPAKFADVVKTGTSFEREEFIYTDRNVREAAFSFKAFPLPDNCMGVLFEDITKRKNAESALQLLNDELEERVHQRTAEINAINRELEAFSYSISHDLRAPLLRITGFADILLEVCTPKLTDEELHYVLRLKEASRRMNELIEALLKLSRVTSSELNTETVNLSNMALEIFSGLKEQEPDRLVTYSVSDGMVADADPILMKSLLDNLINNAWKYSSKKEHAVIEFGVSEQDGSEVYFVRDNGVGFNMRYRDNIFAPFRRLHKDEDFAGIGIGLATVQRIIRRHRGDIWAEGKEGEGATFYFTLQANNTANPERAPEPTD